MAAGQDIGIFGDSLTTDHISPAGAIKETTPAGQCLIRNGIAKADFQSYGTRRGNHEIMIRGTFANVRIKNLMVPPGPDGARIEGGVTVHYPSGDRTSIYEVATRYQAAGVPTIVFGGEEYGTGSSRDWAAKGPRMLGVRAVIAESSERIHRSNLIGMGILPLEFEPGANWKSLGLTGFETLDIEGISSELKVHKTMTVIAKSDGTAPIRFSALARLDTPNEVDYYRNDGILQYVFRSLLMV